MTDFGRESDMDRKLAASPLTGLPSGTIHEKPPISSYGFAVNLQ
jgi:hypothetical protein